MQIPCFLLQLKSSFWTQKMVLGGGATGPLCPSFQFGHNESCFLLVYCFLILLFLVLFVSLLCLLRVWPNLLARGLGPGPDSCHSTTQVSHIEDWRGEGCDIKQFLMTFRAMPTFCCLLPAQSHRFAGSFSFWTFRRASVLVSRSHLSGLHLALLLAHAMYPKSSVECIGGHSTLEKALQRMTWSFKGAHFFFMFLKEQGPSWDILLSTEKPAAHDSDKYISQFERCRFDCDVSIMQK